MTFTKENQILAVGEQLDFTTPTHCIESGMQLQHTHSLSGSSTLNTVTNFYFWAQSVSAHIRRCD